MEEEKKMMKNSSAYSLINSLDDGCLMHIFSFLCPIPDRYNTALVCHRWCQLTCHPRLWLRVERPIKNLAEPGVYSSLEAAISAARPGDTILISAGASHVASNIQIEKPLCLIGGGKLPDDTILTCSRGSDRSGRLTIEGCVLQCEEDPLDYLSFPIISTASCPPLLKSQQKVHPLGDSVTVARTRIEGGAKAVWSSGNLVLQQVRAIYARTSIFFWFKVGLL